MPENSPKFPLVRCPKCRRLLPELPPYSVYRCGGCDGFLQAHKNSPLSNDLSQNSSEGSPIEGSRREGNHGCGVVGIDHDSERSTPTRVSKYPIKFKFGDPTRKSTVRKINSDGLNGHVNSPIRESVFGDFDDQSKSSGRSAGGEDRKSPLREIGCGHGKSPAFSPIGTDYRKCFKRDNYVSDHEEIEPRHGVDSVEESYGVNSPSVSPRRQRTWHKEGSLVGSDMESRSGQVGRRADHSGEEYDKLYGRRRVELPCDDWDGEGDHEVARRNRHLRAQDECFGVIAKPRKRMEQRGDGRTWSDDLHRDDKVVGEHRRVQVHSCDGFSNYRTELLHKYNELHEKLIRVGDLISYGWNGQGDQDDASTDCYSGPDDYVYDEFSGHRTGTVRSAGPKGCTRMRPHYVSDNPSLPQIPGRTIHRQPPYNHQHFVTRQSIDSTYDPRRKYLHHPVSSVDSKLDGGASAHDHKKRVLLVQSGKLCHPIFGGAPFVICYNCFQLLKLPGKLVTTKKSQFRLQCGSCCTILLLDFNKRRSDASDHLPSKSNTADVCDVPREEVAKVASEAEKLSVNGLLPLRPPPGSPLRDHMDCIYATKLSDEKESDTSNQDTGTARREKTCVGNAAVPTELEQNSSEIPRTGSTQGSADTNIRKDEGGCSEAGEISFASVIKGGSQDSSTRNLSTSLANADVFVNGKLITPNAVRRAEKMAGPISPGEYWYDSRAGFWGVMGGVCLGIIPPCIGEFSSQMPENCSVGDTCIYVNGRELHEIDLDLLSSRGLPRTRYKYYVVDISGKVQDEDTGGFVVNLGKFAPTVESTGCGFGMHSPEAHKY